ncbi:MAG: NACHT domain-containing protein, partial [Saprospiraceae bacterium]
MDKKKKLGIAAKKISIGRKKISFDLQAIFGALLKGAIKIAVKDYNNTFKELASLAGAVSLSEDTKDIAYHLLLEVLVNTAHDLASDNTILLASTVRDQVKPYDDPTYQAFLDNITTTITEEDIFIDGELFKNPRIFLREELPVFTEYFMRYLELMGISKAEAQLVANRLPSYFVFAVHDYARSNYTQYALLQKYFENPVHEAARKELEWEVYYTYLEREVDKSVFGEAFGLRQIYIPLRAYFEPRKKVNPRELNHDLQDKTNRKRIVVNLEANLDQWLDNQNASDEIKIISGGPGSGKSSFAKMWAAKVAATRKTRLLFIPLHQIDYRSDLKTAIQEYFINDNDLAFSFDPIEQIKEHFLLIFDGLDELVMQGKTAQQTAFDFITELKLLCNRANNGNKKTLKILIAGRPIAVQNAETRIRGGQEQLLQLVPYFIKKDQLDNYQDEENLLQEDQRTAWWEKFHQLKKIAISKDKGIPTALRRENLDPITTEPLLNYLVALAWLANPKSFNEDTNLNEIYQQLIIRVYDREYEPSSERHRVIAADQYFLILEEIAICAWHGGDVRVTTIKKIEEHIAGRGSQKYLEQYKVAAQGGVSRLLTAFYFKKYGQEKATGEESFEFTHKSFGEYLTARAIVELVQLTHQQIQKFTTNQNHRTQEGWDQNRALKEWLLIMGPTSLDENLIQFIGDEIRARAKKSTDCAKAWQTTFIGLIEKAISSGMPALDHRPPPREEQRQIRNAQEALMIMTSLCAEVSQALSSIDWGRLGFSHWMGQLSSSLHNRDAVFKYLSKLSLGEANLGEANLGGANLWEANLWEANL